jgi:glutaredoxin
MCPPHPQSVPTVHFELTGAASATTMRIEAAGASRQDLSLAKEAAKMADRSTLPNIYLKKTCPFCLKLRVFLSEALLADGFNLIVFEDGDDPHRELRSRMEASGQQPSFPAVELTPGKLETGTDELISRIADQAGVVPASMPLLNYYSDGVFAQYGQMFRELRELRSAQRG